MTSNTPSIAIVGASFSGISAYLILKKNLKNQAKITLIDYSEKFTYVPSLHEVIGNQKRLHSLQLNLKDIYKDDFIIKKVESISPSGLCFDDGSKENYDYVVISTGSRVNHYGNKAIENFTHTIRRAEDLERINQKLLTAKTVTVIGGGFTGVETISVIAQRFPSIKATLIHSNERCLNIYDKKISTIAHNRLTKHGVKIIYNEKVIDAGKDWVKGKSGKTYQSDLAIRTTGIKINDEYHKDTVIFEKNYQAKNSDRIYMCGDVLENGILATAHNAMIEGRLVGHLIVDKILGIKQTYKPVENRSKLAIALGTHDGIITNGTKGFYVPWFVGFAKWFIEQRVLIEFKRKILLRV